MGNSGSQPAENKETPSNKLLIDSDELIYTEAAGYREKGKGIDHKPQMTYTFKDCTFDDSSMLSFTGISGSASKTVVLRDSKKSRTVFASGNMDKGTFLREFCGKQK
ncbi:hypothetical protein Pdw03_6765 [Penicillium digitatum]|uniref:Uncharacterized protein n=1 Tax=Penicillium digitatum TaxID=36651 RepID=A0A7T6XKK3_PENDI|nr:hypothetical protein Pdw03_6765 [Penicillium digitatum]